MNNGNGAWFGQDPRLQLLASWGRLEACVPEGFDKLPWLADRTRVPYRKLHFAKRVRNSVAHGSPVDRGQVAEAIRILDLAVRSLGGQIEDPVGPRPGTGFDLLSAGLRSLMRQLSWQPGRPAVATGTPAFDQDLGIPSLAGPMGFLFRRAGVLAATMLMLFGSLLAAASAMEFVVRATRGTLSWSALCWNLLVCVGMVRGGQWAHRRLSRPVR